MSALEDFIEHFEKFATDSQDYGSVVSLLLLSGSGMNAKDPQTLAKSLVKKFPYVEHFALTCYDNLASMMHFLSVAPKLPSLKSLIVAFFTNWEAELPPLYCPSLQCVVLAGEYNSILFRSLVLPNMNTLSMIQVHRALSSSDLDSLCTGLYQTASLKFLMMLKVVHVVVVMEHIV